MSPTTDWITTAASLVIAYAIIVHGGHQVYELLKAAAKTAVAWIRR